MSDRIIKLIHPLEDGTEETIEVFATVESVSQTEFFSAAQAGFKSEYKVSLWLSDYDDQPIVKFGNKKYSVYRKFERADQKIELYVTSKIGVY